MSVLMKVVVGLTAGVLLAGGSSTAVAAGPAVDHSGERFTLDGKAVETVDSSIGATCGATPSADGTVACFSSSAKYNKAAASALKVGELPAGWLALPSNISASELAKRFEAQSTDPRSTKDSASIARDGYTCKYDNTHIWTSLNATGTAGQQGYTGVGVWANYSSTYDNQVSSFHASRLGWQSRWHDYANGGGAYYGGGYPCYYVVDLRNISMTDGGTANDRFSSFGDW